jgi:hypothetical protein
MTRLLLALCVIAAPAVAQDGIPCGPHDRMAHVLRTIMGQDLQAIALEQRGNLIEMWADEAGQWSMLVIIPDGTACIIATGPLYQAVEVKRGEPS